MYDSHAATTYTVACSGARFDTVEEAVGLGRLVGWVACCMGGWWDGWLVGWVAGGMGGWLDVQ